MLKCQIILKKHMNLVVCCLERNPSGGANSREGLLFKMGSFLRLSPLGLFDFLQHLFPIYAAIGNSKKAIRPI